MSERYFYLRLVPLPSGIQEREKKNSEAVLAVIFDVASWARNITYMSQMQTDTRPHMCSVNCIQLTDD